MVSQGNQDPTDPRRKQVLEEQEASSASRNVAAQEERPSGGNAPIDHYDGAGPHNQRLEEEMLVYHYDVVGHYEWRQDNDEPIF